MPGLVPSAYLCSFVTTYFTPVLHMMEPTRRRLPQSAGQQSVALGSDWGSLAPKSRVDPSAARNSFHLHSSLLSEVLCLFTLSRRGIWNLERWSDCVKVVQQVKGQGANPGLREKFFEQPSPYSQLLRRGTWSGTRTYANARWWWSYRYTDRASFHCPGCQARSTQPACVIIMGSERSSGR